MHSPLCQPKAWTDSHRGVALMRYAEVVVVHRASAWNQSYLYHAKIRLALRRSVPYRALQKLNRSAGSKTFGAPIRRIKEVRKSILAAMRTIAPALEKRAARNYKKQPGSFIRGR